MKLQKHRRNDCLSLSNRVFGWSIGLLVGSLTQLQLAWAQAHGFSSSKSNTDVLGNAHSTPEVGSTSAADLLLAAPENLNPGLYRPPPSPTPEPSPEGSLSEEPQTFTPWWEPTDLTVSFDGNLTNLGQDNFDIEASVEGRLPNGDRLAFTTGISNFGQTGVSSVLNLPLRVAWTREMGDFTTTLGGGVDIFDRLPWALNFEASASVPLGSQANLSFDIEQGPYKFNAATLENQITAWRYGPSLYWQIDPDTSFFSLVRWGRYSDGNREQQSFSRLEQRFGDFSVAANVFNWRYERDAEASSGYFSPQDFLVANIEGAWQGNVLPWLDCKAAVNLGQQRLGGNWSPAYGYEALCTAQVSETVELDLGYKFSTVSSQGSSSNSYGIQGQVRASF